MLIDYLIQKENLTHKKAKIYLTNKYVYVNGRVQTKYNYLVKDSDEIKIIIQDKENNLKILYEDKYIIAVYKKAGLLTISTEKKDEKTLYHFVSDYLKKKNKNAKVFIIHRLDRDTSGIVIFAKDEKTKRLCQDNWDSIVKMRGYMAVVEGKLEGAKKLVNYLKENQNFKVYVTNYKEGKKAITNYTVIKSNENYSLLDIDIETGRKNQIRVQLSNIGHPIVGDKKYGSKIDLIKRLCLEADELILTHPITKKELSFKLDMNNQFINIFSKYKN